MYSVRTPFFNLETSFLTWILNHNIGKSFNPPSLAPLVTELCSLLSFFCFLRLIAKPGYLIVMTTHGNCERWWRHLLDPYAAMDRPAAFCDISYLLTDRTPFSNYFKSSSRVTWLTSLLFIMLLLNCSHENSTAKT